MFCPKCKSEFREGFSRCGSCDVDLVPELPPEPEEPAADVEYMDLVNIRTYSHRHEADLGKSFLSANDIYATLSGDDCGGFRPALAFTRGFRLLVKKEDAERAVELLKDARCDVPEEERPEPDAKPVSSLLSKIFVLSFLVAIVSGAAMIFVWETAPESRFITPSEVTLLVLWGAALLTWCVVVGVIAHRLGRRWLIWSGFALVTGPIGLLIVYFIMRGYIKKARDLPQPEAAPT